MAKIFQEFHLLTDEKVEEGWRKKGEELTKKLIEKGYVILVSGECFCGVPASIIIGAETDPELPSIKQDFSDITEKLDLPFSSGPWYMEKG